MQKQLTLRTRGVGLGGGVGWDVNVHVNLQGGKLTFMMDIYYIYTGLATRTPGRRRERSSKLCETCSCCDKKKTELVSHVSGRGPQTPCSCSY